MKMDVPEMPEESIINLSQLLSKWRLEFLLRQFIEEKIDEEVLQMIDASHIKVLLNKYPMGVQIRFAHHLDKWRKSIGKPLKPMTFNEFTPTINPKEVYSETYSVVSDRSQTSTIPIDLNGSISEITILSDNVSTHTDRSWGNLSTGTETSTELHSINNGSSISNSKPKSQNSSKIDLEEILLNSPPNGPDLIQLYERQKHFTHIDRKRLVSTIVNYYLECKLPLDLGTSYDLENAIMKMFPNETLGMYRNSRQGKIFNRYTREKAKEMESEKLIEHHGIKDTNEADLSMYLPNESFRLEELRILDAEDGESIVAVDHDVLIQTIFEGQKKFTKIRTPFLYNSFLTTACEMFNIIDVSDYCLFQNGCEIEEDRFKNLIIKFYKSPTFTLELKHKNKSLEPEVISNHLPDVEYIRKMPAIIPLLMLYENGKPLQNMHRTTIAKTLIDECLKFNPERILKKADLQILTENICKTFHTEVPSTYFVPCHRGKQARGKLWCAYTNKRKLLCSTGLVAKQRNRKRKMSLDSNDHDDEDNNDAESPAGKRFKESEEFSVHTNLDLETLVCRWEETHEERRYEILQGILSPQEYMLKYSILQSDRGVHLMEMDVKQMHPTMGNMDNWLQFYNRVVDKARDVRKYKHVPKLIEIIDASHDIRYRASLALNLLVYIFTSFPRCSKPEIQNRFLKEYKCMDDLMNDGKPAELQIRFVHQSQRIVYADFTACGGFTYKFVDLFEALTHCFHYIMALNLEYPKICQCLWQFVQLAIFQIDIDSGKLPQIESTINDLLYVPKD